MSNHFRLWVFAFALMLGMFPMFSSAQQPLPDLVVSKMWIGDRNNTPIVPRAGEPFYLCATVKNLGNAHAEGYYVQPYFGGSPLAAGGPGRLEVNDAQDWASGPVTVGPGIYEVRWVLNPDRRIPEGNYGNNEISMIMAIEASSPIEALLQPVGGFIGLGTIVLIVLALGVILRKYLERRKRATPGSPASAASTPSLSSLSCPKPCLPQSAD